MRFWELFIIVVVAVSFAGFFVFTGIMLFTKRGQETLQKWEKEKEEKERLRRLGKRYRYLILIYGYRGRAKYPLFLKFAKTREKAMECADKSIGKKEGYGVCVYTMNTFTGKIHDCLYNCGFPPSWYNYKEEQDDPEYQQERDFKIQTEIEERIKVIQSVIFQPYLPERGNEIYDEYRKLMVLFQILSNKDIFEKCEQIINEQTEGESK